MASHVVMASKVSPPAFRHAVHPRVAEVGDEAVDVPGFDLKGMWRHWPRKHAFPPSRCLSEGALCAGLSNRASTKYGNRFGGVGTDLPKHSVPAMFWGEFGPAWSPVPRPRRRRARCRSHRRIAVRGGGAGAGNPARGPVGRGDRQSGPAGVVPILAIPACSIPIRLVLMWASAQHWGTCDAARGVLNAADRLCGEPLQEH